MLIFVEGIDKTGKDTIVKYINEMTNYSHCVMSRGPLSSLAYATKFDRKFDEYNFYNLSKSCIIILLYAELDDLNVRFRLTNEPEIDKHNDIQLFNATAEYLTYKYDFKIIPMNTTISTPYNITKEIIKKIKEEE